MSYFQEEWKFYKETYNFRWGHRIYYVSNYGRVKCNGKLFKCPIINGYYYLCRKPLHRIVAEQFIPGYDENYELDHKDCNKLNNMVTNLLLCKDHKQNMNNPLTIQHMIENSQPKKSVIQYTLDNKFVKEYVSIQEAFRQTKIYHGNIVKCCKQRIKSAGGYIWKYKED